MQYYKNLHHRATIILDIKSGLSFKTIYKTFLQRLRKYHIKNIEVAKKI